MSRLDKLSEALQKLGDQITESEAWQQLRSKYDELDSQSKLYINIGALGATVLFVVSVILLGVFKVNGLKADVNEREEMIGYLQQSADQLHTLKAQSQTRSGLDPAASLPNFVNSVVQMAGIDASKVEVGAETTGVEEKETREMLLEVKFTQTNLRILTRFLFTATEQGAANGLNIKQLSVDTKEDPAGYMDASVVLAAYRAK